MHSTHSFLRRGSRYRHRELPDINPGGNALQHELYDSFSQACHLRGAWDDLAAAEADLFCSFDWCATWWKHYGNGRQLEIHVFAQQGSMVAVVPLFRETHRIGPVRVRTVRIVGSDHTTATCNIAIRRDRVAQVIAALLDQIQRVPWDMIHVGLLPGYSPHAEALVRGLTASDQVRRVERVCDPRPHTLIDLPGTFEDYLQQLSKRERHNIRKEHRRLAREHGMCCDNPVEAAGAVSALRQFIDMHQHQWKQKNHPGHFADWPRATAFHQDLVLALEAAGRLRLRRIRVDGEPFCMAYAFRFGRRLHWFLAARSLDPRWHFCFPGRIGACDLATVAIGEGLSQIDMGLGYYDYKLRLGGRLFPTESITAVRLGRWTAMNVRLLRTAALVHDLLGHRLLYHHLLCRLPGIKVRLLPRWIRTRMWPADAQEMLIRCKVAVLWPASMIARARRRLSEVRDMQGLKALVEHQFNKLLHHREVVFALATETLSDDAPGPPTGFTVRRYRSLFELNDVERTALREHSGSMVLVDFRRNFLHGNELWVAYIEDKPAGICWSLRGDRAGFYYVPLSSSNMLIQKCFTFSKFQRRGVFSSTLRHMCNVFADEGVQRVFIDCKTWNIASIRGILKAGFRELGTATFSRSRNGQGVTWHTRNEDVPFWRATQRHSRPPEAAR